MPTEIKSACRFAAQNGDLEKLKQLREDGYPWDEWTCAYAARDGHLEVLKWARSQDPPCPWDTWTCTYAATEAHFDIINWVRSQNPPCPWDHLLFASVAFTAKLPNEKRLKMLQWLKDNGCPLGGVTTTILAHFGNIDLLKKVYSMGCPLDDKLCEESVKKGYVNILAWAISNRAPFEIHNQSILL